MLEDLNPTTRCFPRTENEAFQNTVEAAQWWFPPEYEWRTKDVLLLVIGAFMWIGLAYYFVKN